MGHDCLIVGAGSAGAVLAARLSEDPQRNVLLLEAGADYATPEDTPADLLDARGLAGMAHDWQYTAIPVRGRRIAYRRGRVSGGTSAINAAAAQWGRPEDFAAWERMGNAEWSWDRMRPIFLAIESDDFGAPGWHGRSGPVPITRYAEPEWIPIQKGFRDACVQAGMATIDDHNSGRGSGVGSWPMNRRGLTRVSTALAYLGPARGRANLQIRPNAMVDRVLFEGQRATGIQLIDGERLYAQEVVLCAGAIGSPAVLLRSGIGPGQDLSRLKIDLRCDAAGVGTRLWDHAAVPVYLRPRAGECVAGRDPRFQVMATLTSCGSSEPNDLQLVMTSHLDVSMLPIVHEAAGVAVVAVLRAALMLPKSCGRVRLDSADPLHAPKIELNYLAEPEDRRRLREVTRKAWQVATASDLRAVHDGVVLPDSETVADDDRLDAYMHEHINTYCHALGTVAMGRMDDALAAADAEGRVRGVSGLRVVDASLMPCAPRVVPNMTVIAMAERISRDWDHTRRSGTSESAPRNHAEPD